MTLSHRRQENMYLTPISKYAKYVPDPDFRSVG
jgi:hypothetical protein